jgi:hypothetical protein
MSVPVQFTPTGKKRQRGVFQDRIREAERGMNHGDGTMHGQGIAVPSEFHFCLYLHFPWHAACINLCLQYQQLIRRIEQTLAASATE